MSSGKRIICYIDNLLPDTKLNKTLIAFRKCHLYRRESLAEVISLCSWLTKANVGKYCSTYPFFVKHGSRFGMRLIFTMDKNPYVKNEYAECKTKKELTFTFFSRCGTALNYKTFIGGMEGHYHDNGCSIKDTEYRELKKLFKQYDLYR